jgi:hypothetical protein
MAESDKESDSEQQQLQAHWRALATASFRRKIFVKSTGTEDEREEKVENNKSKIEIGESVSGFYQEVLQMPSTSTSKPAVKRKRKEASKKEKIEKVPFNKESFFCFAMSNRLEEIQKLLSNSINVDLDATDNFGWTALMIAACENSLDCFSFLLECGADLNIKDRTGNTAESLAQKKHYTDILTVINDFRNRTCIEISDDSEKEEEQSGTDFCSHCKIEIKRSSSKSHQSSTVHLFSCKYNTDATIKSFGIARSNRGYKLMKTIGWDGNSALGARKNGKLYPVKTILRHKRTGLGIKQDNAKITHFKAHDVRAVHFRSQPHAPTRKEILEQSMKEKRKEQMIRRALS